MKSKCLESKLIWERVNESLCNRSIRRCSLFRRNKFRRTGQPPWDWELRMGFLTARLSWYGSPNDGCWAMNFPLLDKMERDLDNGKVSAQWRITGISSSEQAKKYVEDYVLQKLVTVKELVDNALDCFPSQQQDQVYERTDTDGSVLSVSVTNG